MLSLWDAMARRRVILSQEVTKKHTLLRGEVRGSKDFWVLLAIIYFVVMLIIGFTHLKRSNSSATPVLLRVVVASAPWLTALSAEASDMSGLLLMDCQGRLLQDRCRRSVMDGVGPSHRTI